MPTGLWPTCLWPSSSWPQLSSYRLRLGPWLGHPSTCLVGWGSPNTHLFLNSRPVGYCFPGRLVRGPAWGNHSPLPHCESLEASTIARQGLRPQGQVCVFPHCLQLLALGPSASLQDLCLPGIRYLTCRCFPAGSKPASL